MAEAPKRNDPQEWTNVAAAYEEVNEPFMALWAQEALGLANLAATERVLDVATGPGTLAVRAAPLVKEVIATDYSDGMILRLKARVEREGLKNVHIKQMNGQQLELASESFDAAFSIFGLIFFPDRSRGFGELLRVLKPGGRAVVAGWAPMERMPFLAGMMRGIREALPDLPAPPRPVPAESLADPTQFATEMIEAGFDEVSIITRRVEMPVEGTVEELFERQAPANLMVASLKQRLSPEEWKRVSERACAGIREALGTGPLVLAGEANLGIGFRPADEE